MATLLDCTRCCWLVSAAGCISARELTARLFRSSANETSSWSSWSHIPRLLSSSITSFGGAKNKKENARAKCGSYFNSWTCVSIIIIIDHQACASSAEAEEKERTRGTVTIAYSVLFNLWIGISAELRFHSVNFWNGPKSGKYQLS